MEHLTWWMLFLAIFLTVFGIRKISNLELKFADYLEGALAVITAILIFAGK